MMRDLDRAAAHEPSSRPSSTMSTPRRAGDDAALWVESRSPRPARSEANRPRPDPLARGAPQRPVGTWTTPSGRARDPDDEPRRRRPSWVSRRAADVELVEQRRVAGSVQHRRAVLRGRRNMVLRYPLVVIMGVVRRA